MARVHAPKRTASELLTPRKRRRAARVTAAGADTDSEPEAASTALIVQPSGLESTAIISLAGQSFLHPDDALRWIQDQPEATQYHPLTMLRDHLIEEQDRAQDALAKVIEYTRAARIYEIHGVSKRQFQEEWKAAQRAAEQVERRKRQSATAQNACARHWGEARLAALLQHLRPNRELPKNLWEAMAKLARRLGYDAAMALVTHAVYQRVGGMPGRTKTHLPQTQDFADALARYEQDTDAAEEGLPAAADLARYNLRLAPVGLPEPIPCAQLVPYTRGHARTIADGESPPRCQPEPATDAAATSPAAHEGGPAPHGAIDQDRTGAATPTRPSSASAPASPTTAAASPPSIGRGQSPASPSPPGGADHGPPTNEPPSRTAASSGVDSPPDTTLEPSSPPASDELRTLQPPAEQGPSASYNHAIHDGHRQDRVSLEAILSTPSAKHLPEEMAEEGLQEGAIKDRQEDATEGLQEDAVDSRHLPTPEPRAESSPPPTSPPTVLVEALTIIPSIRSQPIDQGNREPYEGDGLHPRLYRYIVQAPAMLTIGDLNLPVIGEYLGRYLPGLRDTWETQQLVTIPALFDWTVRDAELHRLILEEFRMYRFHTPDADAREAALPTMWHSATQQVVRQSPVLWLLTVLLRPDHPLALIAAPSPARYAHPDCCEADGIEGRPIRHLLAGTLGRALDLSVAFSDEPRHACRQYIPRCDRILERYWTAAQGLPPNAEGTEPDRLDAIDPAALAAVHSSADGPSLAFEPAPVDAGAVQVRSRLLPMRPPAMYTDHYSIPVRYLRVEPAAADPEDPTTGSVAAIAADHASLRPPAARQRPSTPFPAAMPLGGLGPISDALLGRLAWSDPRVVTEAVGAFGAHATATSIGAWFDRWNARAAAELKRALQEQQVREARIFGPGRSFILAQTGQGATD